MYSNYVYAWNFVRKQVLTAPSQQLSPHSHKNKPFSEFICNKMRVGANNSINEVPLLSC